ncbi:MAG TPA: hypothetical protein VK466_12345 [Terriglobales bacterium]|nr:hypothetical protein [Terriglobales bacterium]
MTAGQVFQRLTSVLERVGIPYMLSGSFASAYYGTTRSTQDIDLVIEATPAKLEALARQLPQDEYYIELTVALEAYEQQSLFNVIDRATGWKIDLIIRKARAFSQEEFRRRRQITLHGVPVFVASAEDVIISKLEWSKLSESQRQLEDASSILRSRWDQLDRVYLKKWLAALQLESQWKSAIEKAGVNE